MVVARPGICYRGLSVAACAARLQARAGPEGRAALVVRLACRAPHVHVVQSDTFAWRPIGADELGRGALDAVDDFAVPVLMMHCMSVSCHLRNGDADPELDLAELNT